MCRKGVQGVECRLAFCTQFHDYPFYRIPSLQQCIGPLSTPNNFHQDIIDKSKDSFTEWTLDPKRQGIKEGIKVTPLGKFFEVGKWFLS